MTIACNLETQSPREIITHEPNARRVMQGYLLRNALDAPADFLVKAVGWLGLVLVCGRLWVAEGFLEGLAASHHLCNDISMSYHIR
jgi:hypothetical protein